MLASTSAIDSLESAFREALCFLSAIIHAFDAGRAVSGVKTSRFLNQNGLISAPAGHHLL